MEKTVASRYWTGMMLFSIDRSQAKPRPRHKLLDTLYEGSGRVMFKGQLFSAPMNWDDLVEQLERLEASETHISLPVVGAVLASRECASPSPRVLSLSTSFSRRPPSVAMS